MCRHTSAQPRSWDCQFGESRTLPGLVHPRSPALSTEQVEVCTGVLGMSP